MWTTFVITLVLLLSTGYFFFVTRNRRVRFLEGLVAAGSMMVCWGIAPHADQGIAASWNLCDGPLASPLGNHA